MTNVCFISLTHSRINTHYNVHVGTHCICTYTCTHLRLLSGHLPIYSNTLPHHTHTLTHPHTSATFQFLLSRVNLLSALTLHLQDERSQLVRDGKVKTCVSAHTCTCTCLSEDVHVQHIHVSVHVRQTTHTLRSTHQLHFSLSLSFFHFSPSSKS